MQPMTKERVGLVVDRAGVVRPFQEQDLPAIGGFWLGSTSLGDVLCMTPMVEAAISVLQRRLHVWTHVPEVFRYHPQVTAHAIDSREMSEFLHRGHVLFTAPSGTTQDALSLHLVDNHSAGIVDLQPYEKSVVLYSSESERLAMREKLEEIPQGKKRIVIHPAANHAIRMYPRERWIELTRLLVEDFHVISVGKDTQYHWLSKSPFEMPIEHPQFFDWRNRLSLHGLYETICASDLVITFDSGVLHVASATQTPVVAMFSDIDPAARMGYDEKGTLGGRTTVVSAPCPFQFCSSRFGYNDDKCRTQETAFMQCLPSAHAVAQAARKILGTPSRS